MMTQKTAVSHDTTPTKTLLDGALALTMVATVGLAAPAFASEVVTISAIELKGADGARELTIRGSRAPTFSVFRMTAPPRLLVDLSGAELASAVAVPSGDALVRGVAASKLADEHAPMVRVELTLASDVEYDARAVGDTIVVSIRGAAKAAPLTKLGRLDKKVRGDTVTVSVPFSGPAPAADAVAIQQLDSPSRIVVDIAGATSEPKWQKATVGARGIQRARLGVQDDGVRIVLDLEGDATLPEVDVSTDKSRLNIVVRAPKAAPAVAANAPAKVDEPEAVVEVAVEAPKAVVAEAPKAVVAEAPKAVVAEAPKAVAEAPKAVVEAPKAARAKAAVAGIKFEPKDGFFRLTVEVPAGVTVVKDASSTRALPVLRLVDAALPEALVRTLDTSAVAGAVVSAVSSYTEGGDALLAAQVGGAAEHRHWQKGDKLYWDFRGSAASDTTMASHAEEVPQAARATAGYQTQLASDIARTTVGQRARYTGRRISLDLKDAEIQNVLRLLADVSQLNIIAGEEVKGRVTLKLKNVPWDQALDIILQARQLDKVRSGNIIRIAPLDVLEKEAQLRLQRQEANVKLEPLAVRLVPVSYATASGIQAQATNLLSSRGKLSVDARTNVLIVEDVPASLEKIERLIRTLDTQTPQVLIEARIVQARTSFSRQLGIQWGGSLSFSQALGNSTGLGFPNEIAIAGGAGGIGADGLAGPTPNFLVNLPAPTGVGSGAGLGFTFGSAGGAALLHLRLSAAESDGKTKTISSPKVVTLDNTEAKIVAGEQIPITVVTANGPSTRFIAANLELSVTPHVTTEGSVMMKVKATQNELSERTDNFGTPGILTREAETQMLVPDGETAVLGGIYRRTARESRNLIPFLGDIPVLGWLFKNTTRTDDRDELLIFISPRIVNRSQALVNAQ